MVDNSLYAPRPAAIFASDPSKSRGRLHRETESIWRTPFQRDRDRVLHSTAFRRLKHKTQVFVYHEGDHYRTRLTHSLEVAQIARSIARMLGLNEDLAETLALAHDLGHPPFGHAGEDGLNSVMENHGGFDHNAQTLRVLTTLECRYALFNGLNLTWETLEGVLKHNGPLIGVFAGVSGDTSPHDTILEYLEGHDLEIESFASAEAQVAAIADDIAYNNHDIDDGLRAKLFDLEQLEGIALVGKVLSQVRSMYPNLERPRIIYETIRRLISEMILDVVQESGRRIKRLNPQSSYDVRYAGYSIIGMSDEFSEADKTLKKFLFNHMYRHDKISKMSSNGRQVVKDIFKEYFENIETFPEEWRRFAENSKGSSDLARLTCDFVAGMTDRYALSEHKRIFKVKKI